MTPAALAARVKMTGHALGFDRVSIGPAGPPEHGDAFVRWLEAGHAGTMTYLERGREKRLDPDQVLPGVRSLVACALNYHQGPDAPEDRGVARYARGEDYHEVMTPRLRALHAEIEAAVAGARGRVYVDTGPLLERDLAARAGLGWVGKNTMLLHPELGSYFFIGIVLTTAELEPDVPGADRCGSCTRCLTACPTQAFVAPYVLDARRCIAYLTIEHRGPIPEGLRAGIGDHLFGCDVCQDVCPWNRRAPRTREAAFLPGPLPTPAEVLALDEDDYRTRLRGSPLRRARRTGLARNAAVALGNAPGAPENLAVGSGSAGGAPSAVQTALVAALRHTDPTVRGHAAWALGRHGGPNAREALLGARERDPEAAAEIDAALARLEPGVEGGTMEIDPTRDALIVVDVQNDFCPEGALAVAEGDRVVPVLNRQVERFVARGAPVLFTRDWHPSRTRHFQADGGSWPPHCVEGTPGAAFHRDLQVPPGALIVSKGMDPDEDAYSAFQGRLDDGTPLGQALTRAGVRRLHVGGLATDYCVRATALDALRQGFEVLVLTDAVRAVDVRAGDGERALEEMRAAGARLLGPGSIAEGVLR